MDKKSVNKQFGKRLHALRMQKGITPSQFYDASGIDADTLRRYESGELEPKLVTITVIAKALGVSQLELMNFDITDQ